MTKLEAIKLMLEIITECDKHNEEGDSCPNCPFSDGQNCLASSGNDIPHDWRIKDKLREI